MTKANRNEVNGVSEAHSPTPLRYVESVARIFIIENQIGQINADITNINQHSVSYEVLRDYRWKICQEKLKLEAALKLAGENGASI